MVMTQFAVVLRGYDRVAVDALVAAIDAAAGDRERIDSVVAERGSPRVVLRGYDRAQVDAWLARCRVAEPDAGKASPSAVPGPELVIVLRGYRMAETDGLLATIGVALANDDPFRRTEAMRAIASARLPVSIRGYDRGRIDTYLERVTQALHLR